MPYKMPTYLALEMFLAILLEVESVYNPLSRDFLYFWILQL